MTRSSTNVPAEMDVDEDELDIIGNTGQKPSTQQQIMVSVPPKETTAYSSLSASSLDGTAEDGGSNSNGYETPLTTTNPTPVESDAPKTRRSARVSASARVLQLKNSSFALGGKKRVAAEALSRDSTPDVVASDAALAKALQAQEFGDESSKRRKITGGGAKKVVKKKTEIPNSTDDPGDDSVPLARLPVAKRSKGSKAAPAILPARKSLKKTMPDFILDSEEESPLSDFNSDISEASIDSDADDSFDEIVPINQNAWGSSSSIDSSAAVSRPLVPTRVPRRRREFLTRVRPPPPIGIYVLPC